MAIEVKITKDFDLAKVSRRLLKLAGATLSVIGNSYSKETRKNVVRKQLFKSRTGALLNSIMAVPESDTRIVIFGAGKDNFLEYGKFLEFGTRGPYLIRPRERKALAIPTLKGLIFRKKAVHPGIRPRRYFFGDYEKKMAKAVNEGRLFFRSKLSEVLSD